MQQKLCTARLIFTLVFKTTVKQYSGIGEFHALTQRSKLRCNTTPRDAAARQPVDCVYSSVRVLLELFSVWGLSNVTIWLSVGTKLKIMEYN